MPSVLIRSHKIVSICCTVALLTRNCETMPFSEGIMGIGLDAKRSYTWVLAVSLSSLSIGALDWWQCLHLYCLAGTVILTREAMLQRGDRHCLEGTEVDSLDFAISQGARGRVSSRHDHVFLTTLLLLFAICKPDWSALEGTGEVLLPLVPSLHCGMHRNLKL